MSQSYVADPGRIDDLVRQQRSGELSAVDLLERCLSRSGLVQPHVEPWRQIDAEGARAQARHLDAVRAAGDAAGPLHGIPVAIKDIIDVCGLPTRCNSLAREDAPAAEADAEVVAALRAAGAVILGKAHTTEFAFFDPSPARNPHAPGHTPGGSSSGSAAAVAAGCAPLAIGTQTAASVNRPAAYCGVAAFKPGNGLLSSYGISPLAPSYDTAGLLGRTVADAVAGFRALCPAHARHGTGSGYGGGSAYGLTVARLDDALAARATPEVSAVLETCAARFAQAGHRVVTRTLPVPLETLRARHWQTLLYEVGRVQRPLLDEAQGRIGSRLLGAIREGLAIDEGTYLAARREIDTARAVLCQALGDVDAVLWPAAPATAPAGLDSTGDPRFITPWTALGGPIVTMPAGYGDGGLPIGVLLCGQPGTDWAFAAIACRLAAAAEV